MIESVASLSAAGAGSNDVGDLDDALEPAEAAPSMQKSYALTKLHIKSCCATRSFVPLWDYNSVVRWS